MFLNFASIYQSHISKKKYKVMKTGVMLPSLIPDFWACFFLPEKAWQKLSLDKTCSVYIQFFSLNIF